MAPRNLVDVYRCYGRIYCLRLQSEKICQVTTKHQASCLLVVTYLAYPLTLKKEAISSSEMSIYIYQAT
jgi:hypothetical protein